MHILLSDSISAAQVDAAELMLRDFYKLLPELYGEASCTANAHLLSHLTKYVRLWGPLWTHSTFGFESKNGHLKHLFHGKAEIHHQLLFNIDVTCTLQQIHMHLLQCESEETLSYFNHYTQRQSNRVGNRSYIVGKCKLITPSSEESTALDYIGNIEVYFRLLQRGILYHSSRYKQAFLGKRDNIHCCYRTTTGKLCLGRIEFFSKTPRACAFIRELQPLPISLMGKAGHPCRRVLQQYQHADLLSSYVIPINMSTIDSPLIAVPIDSIISKLCIIPVVDCHYCVIQPNNIERH